MAAPEGRLNPTDQDVQLDEVLLSTVTLAVNPPAHWLPMVIVTPHVPVVTGAAVVVVGAAVVVTGAAVVVTGAAVVVTGAAVVVVTPELTGAAVVVVVPDDEEPELPAAGTSFHGRVDPV